MDSIVGYKEIFSAAAIALTVAAYWPYIRSIRRGTTKPHVFTWVIWGSVTFVVFLAQLADDAGIGAWPIGVSGAITLYVTYLAIVRRSDTTIVPVDWLFLIVSLSALPVWYITADPLWAVVILTTVDTMGFGPTFRKAYARPFEERPTFFALLGTRNILSIVALENYSLTTLMFPAVSAGMCTLFILMVGYRRRIVA